VKFIAANNGLEGDPFEAVKSIVMSASYMVLGLGNVFLGAPCAVPVDPRHRLVVPKYNPARLHTPDSAVGIGGSYVRTVVTDVTPLAHEILI
jgi:urea carboxylase